MLINAISLKNLILISLLLGPIQFVLGQTIRSGVYGALQLAFDESTGLVTGSFEDHTGWDDELGEPRFSCSFYIEGKMVGEQFKISTFHPRDPSDLLIDGTMVVVDATTINLQLADEHGGCWNVRHFTDEPVPFVLDRSFNWSQIRYVGSDTAAIQQESKESSSPVQYLKKGDIICIDRFAGDKAYGTHYGETSTSGWVLIKDLNTIGH